MKKVIFLIAIISIISIHVTDADSTTDLIQPTTPVNTPPTPPSTTQTTAVNKETSGIENLAGSTVLSVSMANIDPNPPVSGDIVDVRIGIENKGGTAIKNLVMEVIPDYPFSLVPGENAINDVGIVEGYQTESSANLKIIKYTLKIDKDAPAGNYELKIKYYESGSRNNVTKSLYIDVKSRANVEVIHIDKTTLIPGEQSSLKFRINNVGNAPLRDITFNWEDKDNAILPVGSDNTRYIKYIDVNDGYDLEYQVIADTNSKQGLYKLNLYLTYADSINGTTKQLSTLAGVYVGGETDFDISFSDSENGETSFNVANIGSNPAYAVLVTIPTQKNWKVSGSNSAMIGNLNSGDYTLASFKLRSSNITQNTIATQNNTIASQNNSDITSNDPNSSIVMRVAYTDTMGKRKILDKDVELDPETITDQQVVQGQQIPISQNRNIVLIIGLVIIVLLVLSYRKQKLIDPDLKLRDIFKGKKKLR